MFFRSLSKLTSTTSTLFNLEPETLMRDLLIKEVRGSQSRTEIPLLVNIAQEYTQRDPGIRTGGSNIQIEGSKKTKSASSSDPTNNSDNNNTFASNFPVVVSSSIKACISSVYAPNCTHSKRRLHGIQLDPHIRQFLEVASPSSSSTTSTSTSTAAATTQRKTTTFQKDDDDLVEDITHNNNKRTSNNNNNNNNNINNNAVSSSSISLFTDISRMFDLSASGNIVKDVTLPSYEPFTDHSNKNILAKEALFSIIPASSKSRNSETKFASEYEKRIFDIIFSVPENADLPNFMIKKQIVDKVLIPFIHDSWRTTNRLTVTFSELLRATKYHKYSSSALNSACILEKDLSLVYHSSGNGGLSNGWQQQEVNEIALVKAEQIVSLKAKNWVELAEKKNSFNVWDLLFGEVPSSSAQQMLSKRLQVKTLLSQPTFARALMPQNASKFRCDLLDLGYDLSSDLLTMIKC